MSAVKIRFFWACLILVVLSSCPVYASSQQGAVLDLKLSCTAKGIPDEFAYVLTDEGGNKDTISLRDGQTGSFVKEYTDVGVYRYTLAQESGTSKDIKYDDTVFRVDVYVTNEEKGLSAACAVYERDSDSKVDQPGFINIPSNPSGTPIPVSPTGSPSTVTPASPTSGNSTGSGSPSSSGSTGSNGSNGSNGSLIKSTTDGTSSTSAKNAKTEDTSDVEFWVLLAGMSLVILTSIVIKKYGRRGTDEEK